MRDLTKAFVAAIGVGLVAGVASGVLAHLAGRSIRPWLACVLTVCAAVLLMALYQSWHEVFGSEPAPPSRPEPPRMTDRKRGGLDVTVRMIERATSDPQRFEILRARLARVTTERVHSAHGVDLRAEPGRARELVGDGLADLVSGARQRPPGRAELEDWMTRLEAL
ncbi:hypothetical protein [Jatrophihabitans endophyticus]|uniref:hypothetical protein n=1 Tax=Jatrophihabitans endophyticus TaxID=1206085 RepID=UPI0019F33BB9|nr:hypothetical protein [Jatrophihabitans endophyticus]MBE7187501.1 hypothetical protein [Jatrophihabitans endophyticus]